MLVLKMRAENVGVLPVGENDRLVGMITDRDIVVRTVAEERSPGNTSVRHVMSDGVCYCLEDDDVPVLQKRWLDIRCAGASPESREMHGGASFALADLGTSETEGVKQDRCGDF